MRVEVVYARAGVQDVAALELTPGAVAGEAVAASGLVERHRLGAADLQLGIYGRRISPDQRLRENDRVEILSSLAASPNEARRLRARRRPARRR